MRSAFSRSSNSLNKGTNLSDDLNGSWNVISAPTLVSSDACGIYVTQLPDSHVFLDDLLNLTRLRILLLDDRQIVTNAERVLQVVRRSACEHLSICFSLPPITPTAHNTDAIAQQICFVHKMRSEDNDAILTVVAQ